MFAFKNQINRAPSPPPLYPSLLLLFSRYERSGRRIGMRGSTDKRRLSSSLSLPDNPSFLLFLSDLPLPELSVGDNARQFLRRLLPRRRTMNLPAAPQLLLVFLHVRPSHSVLFSSFLILPLLRPRVLFLSFFPRDIFLALRLAASLFPASSPGGGLLSVRTQPLAYNETENLRGTRGMRRMITYIETKNRSARRSAALLISLSVVLPASSPSRSKTPGHLAKRAIAARIKRSDIVTRLVSAKDAIKSVLFFLSNLLQNANTFNILDIKSDVESSGNNLQA